MNHHHAAPIDDTSSHHHDLISRLCPNPGSSLEQTRSCVASAVLCRLLVSASCTVLICALLCTADLAHLSQSPRTPPAPADRCSALAALRIRRSRTALVRRLVHSSHPLRSPPSSAASPAMPLVGGSLSSYAPAFSNDDKLLCVPCGTAVKLFSVRTGEAVGVLAGAEPAAASGAVAAAAESTAASSAAAAAVRADGSHAGHTRTVTAVMPHPSNRVQLYTASLDGTVKLWDLYDQVRGHSQTLSIATLQP